MNEIEDTVRDYILREFLSGVKPEELTDHTPLITGGILDSISALILTAFLEYRFACTLPVSELGVKRLDTIAGIASLIRSRHSVQSS